MATDLLEEFRAFCVTRAEGAQEPESEVFWLRGEDGEYNGGSLPNGNDCGDFCGQCALLVPAFPGLLACLLLWLLGDDPSAPRPHHPDGARRCSRCPGWARTCLSLAEEIVSTAAESRDGGWGYESDGRRACDFCGAALRVSLTEYGAKEELSHFKMYPPDNPHDWADILTALDSASDETATGFLAQASKWGFVPSATSTTACPTCKSCPCVPACDREASAPEARP